MQCVVQIADVSRWFLMQVGLRVIESVLLIRDDVVSLLMLAVEEMLRFRDNEGPVRTY
jgi:hypothetical protein